MDSKKFLEDDGERTEYDSLDPHEALEKITTSFFETKQKCLKLEQEGIEMFDDKLILEVVVGRYEFMKWVKGLYDGLPPCFQEKARNQYEAFQRYSIRLINKVCDAIELGDESK
jgi:hypothetical protein